MDFSKRHGQWSNDTSPGEDPLGSSSAQSPAPPPVPFNRAGINHAASPSPMPPQCRSHLNLLCLKNWGMTLVSNSRVSRTTNVSPSSDLADGEGG